MTTIKDELLQRDVEEFFKARADLTTGIVSLTPDALSGALLMFVAALRESKEKLPDVRFKAMLAEYAALLRVPRLTTEDLDAPRYNGLIVRAACLSGIITDLEDGDVGELSPGVVRDLAASINNAINDAFEVSGE